MPEIFRRARAAGKLLPEDMQVGYLLVDVVLDSGHDFVTRHAGTRVGA